MSLGQVVMPIMISPHYAHDKPVGEVIWKQTLVICFQTSILYLAAANTFDLGIPSSHPPTKASRGVPQPVLGWVTWPSLSQSTPPIALAIMINSERCKTHSASVRASEIFLGNAGTEASVGIEALGVEGINHLQPSCYHLKSENGVKTEESKGRENSIK